MVGMTRFERATPSSQARCATKLRYIPIFSFQFIVFILDYCPAQKARASLRFLLKPSLRNFFRQMGLLLTVASPSDKIRCATSRYSVFNFYRQLRTSSALVTDCGKTLPTIAIIYSLSKTYFDCQV